MNIELVKESSAGAKDNKVILIEKGKDIPADRFNGYQREYLATKSDSEGVISLVSDGHLLIVLGFKS